jgi:hypothetical protein
MTTFYLSVSKSTRENIKKETPKTEESKVADQSPLLILSVVEFPPTFAPLRRALPRAMADLRQRTDAPAARAGDPRAPLLPAPLPAEPVATLAGWLAKVRADG